jgi:hypothetical protein
MEVFMRWFLRATAATLFMFGVYLASAVVSLDRLVDAARIGNGAAILERTNLERLRHSLVDQVVSAYLIRTRQNRPVKPLERLLANTYGASIADALISKMLTADNLTNILQKGLLPAEGRGAQLSALGEIDTSKVFPLIGRFSLVKPVEISVQIGDDEAAAGISLHFEGNGWKLSGINLPQKALRELALGLPEPRQTRRG